MSSPLSSHDPTVPESSTATALSQSPKSQASPQSLESLEIPTSSAHTTSSRCKWARFKRLPWHFTGSWWLYTVAFVLVDLIIALILQLGVTHMNPRVTLATTDPGVWDMFTRMWVFGNYVLVLNMLIIGVLYGLLLAVVNRFWVVTPLLIAVASLIAIVEHYKIAVRYETILPSDLQFLHSDAGHVAGFMPSNLPSIIAVALLGLALLIALFTLLHRLDTRRGKLFTSKHRWRYALQALVALALAATMGAYASQVATADSWAQRFSQALGDIPSMWDSVFDAERNGPVVAFIRQMNPKIMVKPSDYSRDTMQRIADRYAKEAQAINATRTTSLNDTTVIYILSESFSDPARVPGLRINHDAMPYIRALKRTTTSGLMLSSGYGGGTANLEYMGLTGLSMANFDPSLTSPYQQLVPTERWTPTINRLWGGADNSIGIHPYEPSMYSRATNYRKFGFGKFVTLEPPDVVRYDAKLGSSPYVSDASAYHSTLDAVRSHAGAQFIQLITMQNHMPYLNWYSGNEFRVTSADSTLPYGSDETRDIQTYAQGVHITDQATQQFLDGLDALDKPVAVVFYGDHLPGIYATAAQDPAHSLALHETDYFIWSNAASKREHTQIARSAYSSPNFFIAQTAEHLNARVNPFIAFLTRLHERVSAMEPPVADSIQDWGRIPAGTTIYLDDQGRRLNPADFDEATRQLIYDYRLIQYDVTAGKGYLRGMSFME